MPILADGLHGVAESSVNRFFLLLLAERRCYVDKTAKNECRWKVERNRSQDTIMTVLVLGQLLGKGVTVGKTRSSCVVPRQAQCNSAYTARYQRAAFRYCLHLEKRHLAHRITTLKGKRWSLRRNTVQIDYYGCTVRAHDADAESTAKRYAISQSLSGSFGNT